MTLEMPARVRHDFISERAIDGIDTSEIGIETKQTSVLLIVEGCIGFLVSAWRVWERRRVFYTIITIIIIINFFGGDCNRFPMEPRFDFIPFLAGNL